MLSKRIANEIRRIVEINRNSSIKNNERLSLQGRIAPDPQSDQSQSKETSLRSQQQRQLSAQTAAKFLKQEKSQLKNSLKATLLENRLPLTTAHKVVDLPIITRLLSLGSHQLLKLK